MITGHLFTFNNNGIARMKKGHFIFLHCFSQPQEGAVFTPNPWPSDSQANECRRYSPQCGENLQNCDSHPFIYKKEKKIHSAYTKTICFINLFLTYNLSLGFCRLLHPSAVELGWCVDVRNLALLLLIWSVHHADMRKSWEF